jgi:hypothetical protein
LGLNPEQNPNKAENVITYWGFKGIQTAYDSLISIGAKANEAPNNVGGEIILA